MKDNLALIDTNILVYAYDSVAGSKHSKAKELLKAAWEEGAIVSLQNLCEFFVVITKKVEKPVSIKQAQEIVEDIIYSKEWVIIDRTCETIINSLELVKSTNVHFWDAVIATTMLEFGIEDIITENVKDFSKIKQIRAINPFK